MSERERGKTDADDDDNQSRINSSYLLSKPFARLLTSALQSGNIAGEIEIQIEVPEEQGSEHAPAPPRALLQVLAVAALPHPLRHLPYRAVHLVAGAVRP